jgi:ubiquinone biosynthesis protein COQ9
MLEEKQIKGRARRLLDQEGLEMKLIKEYLQREGYGESEMAAMSPDARRELMVAACMYAAIRLAQIEARSKFIQKIECR